MRNSVKKRKLKKINIQNLNIKNFSEAVNNLDKETLPEFTWDKKYLCEGKVPFFADGFPWHKPVDDLFYRVNNIGIPGEDFISDAKGLALGCSVTAGCGLWHKWTWPYILSQELGYHINSLGSPGRSLSDITQKIFQYIKKYGKPKNLFILTPDILRLRAVELKDSSNENHYNANTYSWYTDLNSYSKHFKDHPHVYNTILGNKVIYPVEFGMTQFITEISRLEQICNYMDINLRVSSWDGLAGHTIRSTISSDIICDDLVLNEIDIFEKFNLKGFSSLIHTINLYTAEIDNCGCHSDHPIRHNKYWRTAADNSHPGIHAHIHYAERFLGRPVSSQVLDNINQPLPDVSVISEPSKKE